jgi:hypothetical protein
MTNLGWNFHSGFPNTVSIYQPPSFGQRLPALHNDVIVLRIQLEAVADPFGEFGRGQRRAAAQEWVVYCLGRTFS